jgi:hypothetical protein
MVILLRIVLKLNLPSITNANPLDSYSQYAVLHDYPTLILDMLARNPEHPAEKSLYCF